SAEDVAFGVQHQVGSGQGTVFAGEAMEDLVGPLAVSRGHLEDHSALAHRVSPAGGRAVEFARLAYRKSARACSIRGGVRKFVQNGFFPPTVGAGCELKHGAAARAVAAAVAPALQRCAVYDVTVAVWRQP